MEITVRHALSACSGLCPIGDPVALVCVGAAKAQGSAPFRRIP
jgi:hypothetical protein